MDARKIIKQHYKLTQLKIKPRIKLRSLKIIKKCKKNLTYSVKNLFLQKLKSIYNVLDIRISILFK